MSGSHRKDARLHAPAIISIRVTAASTSCLFKIGILFILGFSLAEAVAQAPRIERIHIIERGIYRAETVSRDQSTAKRGIINTVQNAHLINATESVMGQVGVRFGLRYIAVGADGDARLKLVIGFPPSGLRDPATGQTNFQSEFTVRPAAGAINYWEYHFEHDWEIVAGIWTFEFWFGSRKLAEQRFCVSHPNDLSGAVTTIGKCRPQLLQGTR